MTGRALFTSRADLLRLIDGASVEERASLAGLLGFERQAPRPKQPTVTQTPEVTVEKRQVKPPRKLEADTTQANRQPTFWRVIAQELRLAHEIDEQSIPPWARRWLSGERPPMQAPVPIPPQEVSLLHWPRLLGFFRTHLVCEHPSQAPDEPRLVRQVAEAHPLHRIPRKRFRRWPRQVIVVLDQSDEVFPLWNDFERLTERLQDLLGARLKVVSVEACLQPHPSQFDALLRAARLSPEAAISARWLILSDLGAVDRQLRRAAFWRAFLRWLRGKTAQVAPLALVNAPPDRWWEGLGQLAEAAFWDLDQPLHLSRGTTRILDRSVANEGSASFERLLAMLSMAHEARPRLLRKLRRLLPLDEHDVSWEITAWNHPQVNRYAVACALDPTRKPEFQRRFQDYLSDATSTDEWPAKALRVIEQDHQAQRPHIRDSERALHRAARDTRDVETDYLVDAIFRLRDLPEGIDRKLLLNWVDQLEASMSPELIDRNEKLRAVRYMADRERRLQGQVTAELDPRFDFIFAAQPEQTYLLWQQGTRWGTTPGTAEDLPAIGSPIGRLRTRTAIVDSWPENASSAADRFWSDNTPPPWAIDWGEDKYGRWAAFSVETPDGQRITQRLRWIDPGTFTMGSPLNEAERSDDEVPHDVTLSQGYWLADTTCTQALWEAVMGENPSDFKGPERPVEQVSWEDAVSFIQALNGQVEGLALRLPTEAEWEYACRAGTRTPFAWGENITTDQVNYDGNYPYAGAAKGKDRGETLAVKALPCNGWGLYQMHGNLWEWCADGYGAYPSTAVTDPVGADGGEGRVLRGGGWYYYARSARSARRYHSAPASGDHFIGFRLARGQAGAQPAEPRSGRLAERRPDADRPSGAVDLVPQLNYDSATPPPVAARQRLIVASDRTRLTLEAMTKPAWADTIGRDGYGLFADFTVQGIVQRLRWIDPGTFTMGSPLNEAERSDDEIPHDVTLSQGYWLADTTCTQALWEAVMGENPSYFKGPERPVEQVSWEDAVGFIQALNGQVEGLALRLPTEAEWEYACRAGTRTPFAWGENITTDQVNYDGNYPYAGAAKGKVRGETLAVKALSCNGWGLYQMHGNLWEWCADGYGAYPSTAVTDPAGADGGVGRVLRGGSWYSFAGFARSARRYRSAPVNGDRYIGFRLARGQSASEPSQPGPARGPGQAARSADGPAPRTVWSRIKGVFKR